MKIEVLSQKVICSNEKSIHNYFGWPTIARLPDGRLAMVCSGFRVGHLCPFGKVVISYSADEGETWSRPELLIDTPMDDRDAGITVFGENSVIVTSFNCDIEAKRRTCKGDSAYSRYCNGYLDMVEEKGGWEQYVGSTYRMSHDGGRTFGELGFLPITCPHGPAALPDGTLLYVGHKFKVPENPEENTIACCRVYPDGRYEFLSEIANVGGDETSWEPHAIVLPDGKIVVHIRVQGPGFVDDVQVYQSVSTDGGRSFSAPRRIQPGKGGSPAHLILDGDQLISVYGYRSEPCGIHAMFSADGGETWDGGNVIVNDGRHYDMGYPSSVMLRDGSILTVYYMADYEGPSYSVIKQVRWRYSKD